MPQKKQTYLLLFVFSVGYSSNAQLTFFSDLSILVKAQSFTLHLKKPILMAARFLPQGAKILVFFPLEKNASRTRALKKVTS